MMAQIVLLKKYIPAPKAIFIQRVTKYSENIWWHLVMMMTIMVMMMMVMMMRISVETLMIKMEVEVV